MHPTYTTYSYALSILEWYKDIVKSNSKHGTKTNRFPTLAQTDRHTRPQQVTPCTVSDLHCENERCWTESRRLRCVREFQWNSLARKNCKTASTFFANSGSVGTTCKAQEGFYKTWCWGAVLKFDCAENPTTITDRQHEAKCTQLVFLHSALVFCGTTNISAKICN
jgi:hypothetical protein